MPFGLPSVATAYQHNLRSILAAQEARHHTVLTEMKMVLKDPLGHPEPPKAQGPDGS